MLAVRSAGGVVIRIVYPGLLSMLSYSRTRNKDFRTMFKLLQKYVLCLNWLGFVFYIPANEFADRPSHCAILSSYYHLLLRGQIQFSLIVVVT